jgi:hypothetical protein
MLHSEDDGVKEGCIHTLTLSSISRDDVLRHGTCVIISFDCRASVIFELAAIVSTVGIAHSGMMKAVIDMGLP